ncbi:hypothetical protein CJF32_00001386 [Rutstroemia sp. NJR-2017a WRK4]|nr:hypothetical protein CJF32_00001386 [Rutstroemia sp. NJR-2017a WRK4]
MSSNFAPPQIIDGAYIDQVRLMSLLRKVYGTNGGKNNFKVEVGIALLNILGGNFTDSLCVNRYKIYPLETDSLNRLAEVSTTRADRSMSWDKADGRLMSLLKNIYGTNNDGKNNFKVEVSGLTLGVDDVLIIYGSCAQIGTKYIHSTQRMNKYKIVEGLGSGLTRFPKQFFGPKAVKRKSVIGRILDEREYCRQYLNDER